MAKKKKKIISSDREMPVSAPPYAGSFPLIKDPHLQFVLILFLALSWLAFYSFTGSEITWGDHSLKKPEIKETLVQQFDPDSMIGKGLALKDSVPVDTIRRIDTSAQRVLHFGDSQLEGFMPALNDYCIENGHELNSVVWYSSSTLQWGKSDTLSYFIRKFKPTYVIACLGLNELFINKPQERNKYVRHLMNECDSLKFIYVGPAFWKEDTGLDKMLLSTVGRKQYFQSKLLKMDRTKDGAHPTRNAARSWVDTVASWIVNESKYPIKLNKPVQKHRSPPMIILSPSH